jgi:hypothetical protein
MPINQLMTVFFALIFRVRFLPLLFFCLRLPFRQPALIVLINLDQRRVMVRIRAPEKRIEEFRLDYFVR